MSIYRTVCLLMLSCALVIGCGDSASNPVNSSPPAATPTPAPTPTATATPYVPPPNGTAVCVESEPVFSDLVTEVIDEIREERPDIFDYESMPGWIITIRPGRFVQTVVEKIDARPQYRAVRHWYNENALSVKENNEYSETYFILTSFNGVNRIRAYSETCRPAEF
ncbi:MAG: hypothetical protein JXO72_06070 [Vicinamibacteria bacterium]|nr:hypothetical protein [Vicinamibacteria bacterium]